MASQLGNLSSLLGKTKVVEDNQSSKKVISVSPEKLFSTDQVRTEFNQQSISELAESIKEGGQLQPITVWPGDKNGNYRIKYGERRWRACRELGINCDIVVDYEDVKESANTAAQLVENIQRDDLSLMEVANAIGVLKADGMSSSLIAKKLGKGDKWVSDRYSLSDLPDCIQDLYDAKISRDADTLVALKKLFKVDSDRCESLCSSAVENGIQRKVVESVLADAKKIQASVEAAKNAPKGMSLGNQEQAAESDHKKELKEAGLDETSEVLETDGLDENVVEEQAKQKETTSTKKETTKKTVEKGWEKRSDAGLARFVIKFPHKDSMTTGILNLERIDHDPEFVWAQVFIAGKDGKKGRYSQIRVHVNDIDFVNVDG